MSTSRVLVLLVSLAIGRAAMAQEAYLPLAGVKVSLEQGQTEVFLQLIEKFAQQQHLQFETGNFPKEGRTVVNVRIRVTAKTFLVATNFREPNSYELTAYSHESAETWQGPWHDIISVLESNFGEKNVISIKPH